MVSSAGVFGKGKLITRPQVDFEAKKRGLAFDLDAWLEAGSVEAVNADDGGGSAKPKTSNSTSGKAGSAAS